MPAIRPRPALTSRNRLGSPAPRFLDGASAYSKRSAMLTAPTDDFAADIPANSGRVNWRLPAGDVGDVGGDGLGALALEQVGRHLALAGAAVLDRGEDPLLALLILGALCRPRSGRSRPRALTALSEWQVAQVCWKRFLPSSSFSCRHRVGQRARCCPPCASLPAMTTAGIATPRPDVEHRDRDSEERAAAGEVGLARRARDRRRTR